MHTPGRYTPEGGWKTEEGPTRIERFREWLSALPKNRTFQNVRAAAILIAAMIFVFLVIAGGYYFFLQIVGDVARVIKDA